MRATFDNSYARLPGAAYAPQTPTQVTAPKAVALNRDLATELGIEFDVNWPEYLSGNAVPEGAQPIAQGYSGHQFGHWNPQLGDGRAILLGEVVTLGQRFDIQLKGAGRTPWSRGGDGRSWLGPVLREFIVSEAMHALGIPTTRALGAVETGEAVFREQGALPGAVMTRVASSHIRVGTFQFFASRNDLAGLEALLQHTINCHAPQAQGPADFLRHAVQAQAKLIAQWMAVGFIHGVMNTDNSHVAGLTLDYGPCAFMDAFDPMKVFSSIDRQGRYAFGNQPNMGAWNMAQLATALLPLMPDRDVAVAEFTDIVHEFSPVFETAYRDVHARKLGLGDRVSAETKDELIDGFLSLMAQNSGDFTQCFRALSGPAAQHPLANTNGFARWAEVWRQHADTSVLNAANPALIPRNHVIEDMIAQAVSGNYDLFHALWAAVKTPFETPEPQFTSAPAPEQVVDRTFCGT